MNLAYGLLYCRSIIGVADRGRLHCLYGVYFLASADPQLKAVSGILSFALQLVLLPIHLSLELL